MKTRSMLSYWLFTFAFLFVLGATGIARGLESQDKAQVSEAEGKAAKAIETAADANAKMAAAADFIKKYPKSQLRGRIAGYIADQIIAVGDANQKLGLAQKALTIFTTDQETNEFKPALIDAYIKLNRFDDAFSEGSTFLSKNPENVQVLVNLAITGTEQAKTGNPKFVTQSLQFGLKAIELLEADKKPSEMDDNIWGRYKAMLPNVYQEMGIIGLIQDNRPDAKIRLEKAVTLNPSDPFNYALLGSLVNDEYQKVAQTYQSLPAGKSKDDTLAKANQLMDEVIDKYAHAAALSDGKPGYQKLHDQAIEDITPYYKYRHNNSTDGLQQLIDKYKTP